MDSCSKFWGNLEGIWGNPGDIGWKIPGVYRVKKEGRAGVRVVRENSQTSAILSCHAIYYGQECLMD